PFEERAKTTYEQILEKGREEGRKEGRREGHKESLKEGREEGILLVLRAFLKKQPACSDEEVAELFEVPVELVRRVRQSL
ncbi:MAG: hypothetical protein NZM43_05065, partial [Saprospiraceae bacterium]|nr:hypothetical protein [Saprospiraceae bacterium]MDW8483679.1 hypothetical protein [Saprospiraceae bacterium]